MKQALPLSSNTMVSDIVITISDTMVSEVHLRVTSESPVSTVVEIHQHD